MDNLEIKVTIDDVKVEVSVPCHGAEQEEVIAVIKSTVEKAIDAWKVGNIASAPAFDPWRAEND